MVFLRRKPTAGINLKQVRFDNVSPVLLSRCSILSARYLYDKVFVWSTLLLSALRGE